MKARHSHSTVNNFRLDLLKKSLYYITKMNETKNNNTSNELNAAFDNFRDLTAKAVSDIEAFIQMDINAPRVEVERPREAILVRIMAPPRPKPQHDDFRDMMPTSQEFYDCE
jgi:hypothetical protein